MSELDELHKLFYGPHDAFNKLNETKWLGVAVQKCPFDLFIYQEILYDTMPDLLIETGTAGGGSALFFASIFDLLNRGRIITIDKNRVKVEHPRITCLLGDSVSEDVLTSVRSSVHDCISVMVMLDSDHSKRHVLDEMVRYADFVTLGNYLVVEDTNINGHPVLPEHGPGPWEAVDEFISHDCRFEADREREHYLFTFNPRGYLKRVR